jgi:hypothetical protein
LAPKPNKSFAKATTKLGLATTIAALWLTAIPITGAVADVQISAARAAAIQQCNRLAARFPLHDWGNTQIQLYRSCMAQHGQQEWLAKRLTVNWPQMGMMRILALRDWDTLWWKNGTHLRRVVAIIKMEVRSWKSSLYLGLSVGPQYWLLHPSRFNGRKRMWCYRSTALKLELRRALQVSAEGFTERHIAAQLTEPQWLDRVDTAIARWPTAAAAT